MLRIVLFIAFFVMASSAHAQPGQMPPGAYPSMDPGQMQQMMQHAEEMQRCMAGIDQSKMQELQRRGEAMQAEIRSLCGVGKRDEAEAYAIEHGMKLANDPQLKKLTECSRGMMETMMPYMQQFIPKEAGGTGEAKHVCDMESGQ